MLSNVLIVLLFFFFNDTATTEIYTLSLHDALPICGGRPSRPSVRPTIRDPQEDPWPPGQRRLPAGPMPPSPRRPRGRRSEEHTSELQSLRHLVCRLLLEKKKPCSPTYRLTCASTD